MRKTIQTISLLFLLCFSSLSNSADLNALDAARLQLMLKKLTVVGNALYVGAHPDDENTALLAYLSLGKLVQAGYLSLNRGEGGQNLIGSEQGDLLGIIRTQELLAARRVDGAEQFFTRAVDFGFSKSPDESMQKWGKENVLSDVVWVIRKFRPDVIITRFPKEGGGHGHHTASAILAEEAFAAAGDPSRFPEQLHFVSIWKPKRLVWNRYTWGNQPPLTDAEKASMAHIDVGEYSALLGKSYTELAGIGRSMHKSQGFGDSQDRGTAVEYFRHTAGEPARQDLFEGIDLSWKRIAGGEKIGAVLEEVYRSFKPENPSAGIPLLLKAYLMMKAFPPNAWVQEKTEEVRQVIQECAGLWLEAVAKDASATPGSEIKIAATAINRSHFPLHLAGIEVTSNTIEPMNSDLPDNQPVTRELTIKIPEDAEFSQPYWLKEASEKPFASVSDPLLIGQPESAPAYQVRFHLSSGKDQFDLSVPVIYRWVDPVAGERYRNFEVIPDVTMNLKDPVMVYADRAGKNVPVVLQSGAPNVSGEVKLSLANGWTAKPESIPFHFNRKNDSRTITFTVTPGAGAASGRFKAVATVGKKSISSGIVTIDYPHIPPQTVFPPAVGKLVRVDLKKVGEKIGYIKGSGDQIPEALSQVGYRVSLLSDEDLATANLSTFDAIVVGIRAYNTRPQWKSVQPRLLQYVQNGGTMVVQYNTLQELDQEGLGPYPFRVSRDRVSVEDVPVTILKPDHVLLNSPNKITKDDFKGWIQERGLYFPDQWDSHYETILACNDPGESPKAGGILYTRFGKGVYIYTGYSWFRELPAGVPGAYRLFVNLISARGGSDH